MLSVKQAVLVLFAALSLRAQPTIDVHGYIQGRFTDQQGTDDRLEIRRARVIFSGQLVPQLSYVFQADLAREPYILDAALRWQVAPALRITAGQFKIPFSWESLTSDDELPPITRSRAVNSLAPARDTGAEARDVGVQVSGTKDRHGRPLVEYAAGVFRGQVVAQSPSSAHFPAVAGRLVWHPIRGLGIAGDHYRTWSSPAGLQKRRNALEAMYDIGPASFRSEQIWARDGSHERRGGYAMASFRIATRWEPLARADWLTTNTRKSNTTSVMYLAGLNFSWRRYLKIGANAGALHNPSPQGVSSVFLAQTMLRF